MKKILKGIAVILLCLTIFGAGGFAGWRLKPEGIPVPEKIIADLVASGYDFTDEGTWHIIVIKGEAAIILFAQVQSLILLDKKDHVMLYLDVPIKDIGKHQLDG